MDSVDFCDRMGQECTAIKLYHHHLYSKGPLVRKLLYQNEYTFAFSVGDQWMDDPMHMAMNQNGFRSIIVSQVDDKETHASSKLSTHQEVRQLLKYLAKCDLSSPCRRCFLL
ncbi:hypothetical protein VP01_2479g3 [Puccinia sorghi]|uniref:Uncharacterized protein n=1 Tax=Puccinia sorghi TaxID=27349 RepID=A0A0L6V635_9BASI|nr:hypothetical protein VP01_2479g3 [Puccinia sorghi]